MKYNLFLNEENELITERYQLAMERIQLITEENTVKEQYLPYFQTVAKFILSVGKVVDLVQKNELKNQSLEQLQEFNQELYQDIIGANYECSYANPKYACEKLGSKYGKLLSFLYTEIRSIIAYAYEGRLEELVIFLELFIEIYNYVEYEDEFTYKDVKRAIYDFMSDYAHIIVGNRTRESIDPEVSFATRLIQNSDLSDLRYLYLFGEYITENELKIAEFINSLPEAEVKAMADTYTEGFRLGFVSNRLDLSIKSTVVIRYSLGFERMVYYAMENFKQLGLEPIIFRYQLNALNKRQHLKAGFYATSPNKQYDYDHRFDIGLFWDKKMYDRRLECIKATFEQYKDKAGVYAGPAVIEVFGEELITPEDKKDAIKLNKRQQKLMVEYYNALNFMNRDYLKIEEISFTIIAYPIPEIGANFKEIFKETVKVNTLDYHLYQRIQQTIIDSLNQGEYVHILGKGDNHTDMKVMLYPLQNPEKETVFENCVADVNIPVGEVFTSPVLKGTNGVLHVPQIYLHDLQYKELEITFKDGMIAEYTCKNYDNEAKNKTFVKESLMYNHDSIPLGEFAIGTNTTAYMMARKYDIAAQLPILIAEKTGPHFAVGDTCYKMSEDLKTYNPDGKLIVARDNEVSLLRKTEPENAYFNCHTDITLPYDEIKEITVYRKDGSTIPIILDSRFVLPGTEELNKAFDEA